MIGHDAEVDMDRGEIDSSWHGKLLLSTKSLGALQQLQCFGVYQRDFDSCTILHRSCVAYEVG